MPCCFRRSTGRQEPINPWRNEIPPPPGRAYPMKSLNLDLRAFAAALHDALAIAAAVFAAAMLLAPTELTAERIQELRALCAVAIPLQVAVNVFFGLYQGVWRYTSLPDIQRIVFSTLAGTVLVSTALRVAGLDASLGWR